MKEKKFNKEEMMVAIKRNVAGSPCIDVFEKLLSEVDQEVSDIVVSDVSGFLSRAFQVFHESDKVEDKKIKSKLLTKDFIGGVYFKKIDRLKRNTENLKFWEDEAINPDLEKKESYRKTLLLCNYVPAIIKAVIQTKRRSVGLDMNSKKFH